MTSPHDPHTKSFSHVNGSVDELLDRLAVAELCKGWPVYRDASEWANFRSLFAPNATVWTTWSGPRSIDDFIDISKAGKANGVFIMHRECGTLVELGQPVAPDGGRPFQRAIGKMKATITQRFRSSNGGDSADAAPVEFDVDCDCRFIFFCEKMAVEAEDAASSSEPFSQKPPASFAWKAVYVKLIYEKDKILPADGHTAPTLTADERAFMANSLPEGYRYLGAMQRRLGYTIDEQLTTPRNESCDKMYEAMEAWLAGGDIKL